MLTWQDYKSISQQGQADHHGKRVSPLLAVATAHNEGEWGLPQYGGLLVSHDSEHMFVHTFAFMDFFLSSCYLFLIPIFCMMIHVQVPDNDSAYTFVLECIYCLFRLHIANGVFWFLYSLVLSLVTLS